MFNVKDISFKKLELRDLTLLHTWLNIPHVHEFYDKDKENTFADVQKRYSPKIRGEKPTDCYFALHEGKPVGYIQKYFVNDYPELGGYLQYDDTVVSVDLFIGNSEYMGKGFGSLMLSEFLKQVVFAEPKVTMCMIGPEPSNKRAIRAYEKVGFKHVQTLRIGNEPELTYVMEVKNNIQKPNYSEFSNPKLVAIYNTVNGIEGYKDFYVQLAKKLSAKTIIDIGCGSGLLSCELVKNGFNVIGVEPSRAMLELARNNECGGQVEWIESDALQLQNLKADLALMTGHVAQFHLDNTYWSNVLESVHNSLNSGGYLAFESRNPRVQPWSKNHNHIDWPSKNSPQIIFDQKEGEVKWWVELLEVREDRAIYEIYYFFTKSGERLVSVNELVFRSQKELRDSLTNAGFVVEKVYGDWDWSPASEESPELIFVAKKL